MKLLRNSGGVPFLTLRGVYVVRAKQQPDGDTIHFAASAPYPSSSVDTSAPVSPKGEKSVAVRFQSIDAPEKKQPMGARSRDAALDAIGISPEDLGLADDDFTASGETRIVPGWIATHGLDNNKRQLGYVFAKNPGFQHGKVISADEVRHFLKDSVNYLQVKSGMAFPAFYENTEEGHAVIFQDAAMKARQRNVGLWALDKTTTGFAPTLDALGASGALIYPKFYRRVEDWKAGKPSAKAFIDWLKRHPDGKKTVAGAQTKPIPLWQLFEAVGELKVRVPYDVNKLWFSE